MLRLITLVTSIAFLVLAYVIYLNLYHVPDLPSVDLQKWWGDGPPKKEDDSIRPFKIDFSDAMIEDLRSRLKSRRKLTKPLEGIQSEYGINTVYLEQNLQYWEQKYDFKKRAELLNVYPHFKTKIQGLDIHFIRVKPNVTGVNVLPLLMMHGWPSSSKEFVKVIPKLISPRSEYDFVFEVIAVDLPGFGFSQGTNKPGLTPVHMGVIMKNLMRRLGFEKFYIQAGDWGSQIVAHMATLFSEDILGFHSNMPLSSRPISTVKLILGSLFPSLVVDTKYANRIYPLGDFIKYLARESGYFHIQATKPDTIGVALTDSPAGLAAYLMEKIAICTNREQLDKPHGGLESLDLDDVLDTVTIAWANSCIVTASRIYAEGHSSWWPEVNILHKIPTPVPSAALNLRYEVTYQPDWILKDKYVNLVRSTTLDFGGHFAGLEVPEVLADEVFASVKEFIKFREERDKIK